MRLERAPPRRPVVAAARRVEVDRVALRGERLRDRGVVRVVLLVERARDRRRHGPGAVLRVQHAADEAVDAARSAGTATPARRCAAGSSCPTGGRGRRRRAARAGARGAGRGRRGSRRARRGAAAAEELVERRDERPRVGRRGRVRLHPVVRASTSATRCGGAARAATRRRRIGRSCARRTYSGPSSTTSTGEAPRTVPISRSRIVGSMTGILSRRPFAQPGSSERWLTAPAPRRLIDKGPHGDV